MKNFWNIFAESSNQAFKELRGNLLRSFLSLVGITIGIICIIGATSVVDSLEKEVRSSFKALGDDVLYVQKWPWKDIGSDWWKYFQRPQPSYKEYQFLSEYYEQDKTVGFYLEVGNTAFKTRQTALEKVYILGISETFFDIIPKNFEYGRFLSPTEYRSAAPKVVLGYKVAENLFGALNPIGQKVKIKGLKAEVVGVIEKSGEGLVNVMNFDEIALIGLPFAKNFVSFGSSAKTEGTIIVKTGSRAEIESTMDEITGIMRAKRRLKPKNDENFSINRLSMLDAFFDSFFNVLNSAGLIIGIFSIFVGMFSVANIMFVSVKERTNLIGIKKALGATKTFILLEFLIESVVLCLIGGLVGLLIIIGLVQVISMFSEFEIFLSLKNALLGMGISLVIGVLAGITPANQAAQMDPVDAIRQ